MLGLWLGLGLDACGIFLAFCTTSSGTKCRKLRGKMARITVRPAKKVEIPRLLYRSRKFCGNGNK